MNTTAVLALPYPYNLVDFLERNNEGLSFTRRSVLNMLYDALSPEERRIVELRWRDSKEYEEIGDILGIPSFRCIQIEEKALSEINSRKWTTMYSSVPYSEYIGEIRLRMDAEERIRVLQNKVNRSEEIGRLVNADISVRDLDIPVRTCNALLRGNYMRLSDVLKIPTEKALLRIPCLGSVSAAALIKCVHNMNLKMAWEDER